ncbi:MAG: tetratricopeptide repeat protein [Nitrospinales bacterium]
MKFFLPFVFFITVSVAHAATPDLSQIQRGDTLLEEWRIDEAEKLIRSLLKKFPNSGDVHFLNARLEFLNGRYENAWNILKHITDRRRYVVEFKSLVNRTRKVTSHYVSQESAHFIFRYEDGPDQILVHYAREVLERSYETLGKVLGFFPKDKVLVEFYPGREAFSQISPLTLKDIMISGTVALCKYNRIMMISPAWLVRGYDWMDTLSHEYVHYILTRKSRNTVPLWFHEGVAKYFETRWRGKSEFLSPIMQTVLARGLANDYMVPLQSMMPSLAKLKTAEDVQLAYAEVSTMVEYMISLKGEQIIPLLVDDLTQGLSMKDALELRLGRSLMVFQNDWKQFMDKKELRTVPGIKVLNYRFKNQRSESEEDEKDYDSIESQAARNLTLLGDILKSRNYVKAAVLEYRKAIKQSKTLSPILYNKLAGTLMARKEYKEAEPLLHKALQFYPMFHTTLANLGELYYDRRQYPEAQDYFERAVRVNPFNPFIHLRLINIYGLLDQPEKKELQAKLLSYIE